MLVKEIAEYWITQDRTNANADEYTLYVALGPTHLLNRSKLSSRIIIVILLIRVLVRICRVLFKIENGMSSTHGVEYALIQTPTPIESIRDVKFVDDEALMIAFSNDC